jgi:hypothetical protein
MDYQKRYSYEQRLLFSLILGIAGIVLVVLALKLGFAYFSISTEMALLK